MANQIVVTFKNNSSTHCTVQYCDSIPSLIEAWWSSYFFASGVPLDPKIYKLLNYIPQRVRISVGNAGFEACGLLPCLPLIHHISCSGSFGRCGGLLVARKAWFTYSKPPNQIQRILGLHVNTDSVLYSVCQCTNSNINLAGIHGVRIL